MRQAPLFYGLEALLASARQGFKLAQGEFGAIPVRRARPIAAAAFAQRLHEAEFGSEIIGLGGRFTS
jgi:hypothetical protein